MKIRRLVPLLCLPLISGAAEFDIVDVNDSTVSQKSWIALPYAFSTDAMGFTMGAVVLGKGYFQSNMSAGFSAYVGAEQEVQRDGKPDTARTYGLIGGFAGYRVPFFRRIFINFIASYAYYPNQRLYLDGSNDSDPQSVIRTQGYNNWSYIDLRFVLPIGEARFDPVRHYEMVRGRVVNRSGCGGGPPFVTGKTVLGFQPFYQKWTMDRVSQEPRWVSAGGRLYVEHDNTDYEDNPSRGYRFTLRWSQDFGGGTTQTWNAADFSYSHYFTMPSFAWTPLSTLALNGWTAYSPSWEHEDGVAFDEQHRPPPWEGARLGGFYRMRGYDSNRFSDRAALYFGAEYRMMLAWNPFYRVKWNPFPIDWIQVVPFVETGRVAPEYDLPELFSHLKFDAGLSLRALAAKTPVRIDVAGSSEGITSWVMIKQPF